MTLQVVRPLDLFGRFLLTFVNVGAYDNFLIGYKVKLDKGDQAHSGFSSWKTSRQWAQLLVNPLTHLLEQNPHLTVTLGNHLDLAPVFLRLTSIDLERLIRVHPIKTSTEIESVLELENNTRFDLSDNTSPLWHLAISPIEDDEESFYMIFISTHLNCDGIAGSTIVARIVEQLNLEPKSLDTNTIDTTSATKITITSNEPLPVPIEDRVDCTLPLPLSNYMKQPYKTTYWSGEIDNNIEERSDSELKLLQLTAQETSKILQSARKRSTTVQAALYAASMFATKSVFMSNTDETLAFGTVFSLRDRIPKPVPREELGNNFIFNAYYDIDVQDDSEFWDMAREYKDKIVKAVSTIENIEEMMTAVGLFDYLPKEDGAREEALKGKVRGDPHGRFMTILASNLGLVPNQSGPSSKTTNQPQYLLDEVFFSHGPPSCLASLSINAATINDKLNIIASWRKAAFKGRDRGNFFASEFKRILLEAVEDDKEKYLYQDAKN
ncbi:hypothetical protein BGZ49_001832 [Haplosporangium sp. Z 27]|nr:hypothetical protein BGZ49_001832 [Haplosporangium sp. Z 27]